MVDCSAACPVLIPLLSLGRRAVVVTEGSGARSGSFAIAAAALAAGGPKLRTTCLTEDLFAVAVMRSAAKDLMAMKVAVVAVGRRAHGGELEVRNEGKSGNKAWLRRRLHAAIVREHLESTGDRRRVGLNHGVSAQIVSCGCWLDHIGHSSTSSLNLDVGWACALCCT